MIGWVRRHSAFAPSGESADHFANRAFERLWNKLRDGGIEGFDNLKSILRYLQLCVHSAIVDHVRAAELDTVTMEGLDHQPIPEPAKSPVETRIGEKTHSQELWAYVETCLADRQERAVIYATFVLDLKPGQIHEEHAQLFPEVGDVYRVKQNVFARLRRDPKINQFLSHD